MEKKQNNDILKLKRETLKDILHEIGMMAGEHGSDSALEEENYFAGYETALDDVIKEIEEEIKRLSILLEED